MLKISFVVLSAALLVTACGDDNGGSNGSGGTGGAATGGAAGAATGGAAGAATGGAAGSSGSGAVGIPCTSTDQCPAGGSGTPECKTDWPGGYCAIPGCEPHGHDCPNDPGLGGTAKTGGKCVLAPTETCLALCASTADCRDGYECVAKPDAAGHGTADVCFPKSSTSGGGGMGSGGTGGMGTGGGGMGADAGMMDGGM